MRQLRKRALRATSPSISEREPVSSNCVCALHTDRLTKPVDASNLNSNIQVLNSNTLRLTRLASRPSYSPPTLRLPPLGPHDGHLSSIRTRLAPQRAPILMAEDVQIARHPRPMSEVRKTRCSRPLAGLADCPSVWTSSGLEGFMLYIGSLRLPFVRFLSPFD